MRKKMKFVFLPLTMLLIIGVIGIAQMCEIDDSLINVLIVQGGSAEVSETDSVGPTPTLDSRVVGIEEEYDGLLDELSQQIENEPDHMQREVLQEQVQQTKAEHQIARTMMEKIVAEEKGQTGRALQLQEVLNQSHEVNAEPAGNSEPQQTPDMLPEISGPKTRNADDL